MSQPASFPGRLAIQQRVLPAYRVPFFDLLAEGCRNGLTLLAGEPRPAEAIVTSGLLSLARLVPARNRHLLGGPAYLCLQSNLLEWLTAEDPQALILEANPRYLSNRKAMAWMRMRGRPVIGWGLGARRGRWLWRRYLKGFDALLAYSTRGAEEYRAAGFPAERVFVAPNAAVGPPGAPPARGPVRAGPPAVLFVGRLQDRKRVDLLLRACARVSPSPELAIVGDGPARTMLEGLARRVYPAARWTGTLQGPDLEREFRRADLFVLPGTGGLAVQQAMAHGLPVIVAEGDGTQRDLVTGDNGWLVPPDDLNALTEALRVALSQPARLRTMGEASYQLVSTRLNIRAMVDIFLRALEAVGAP